VWVDVIVQRSDLAKAKSTSVWSALDAPLAAFVAPQGGLHE
jgi:hypothetical protein